MHAYSPATGYTNVAIFMSTSDCQVIIQNVGSTSFHGSLTIHFGFWDCLLKYSKVCYSDLPECVHACVSPWSCKMYLALALLSLLSALYSWCTYHCNITPEVSSSNCFTVKFSTFHFPDFCEHSYWEWGHFRFKDIFQEVYEEKWKAKFEEHSLWYSFSSFSAAHYPKKHDKLKMLIINLILFYLGMNID